ncbi:MAG: OadG family protein [Oscillospiraceae bacterium]
MEQSGVFVLLLGMTTVFIGLICLIYISKIMSWLCLRGQPAPQPKKAAPPVARAVPVVSAAGAGAIGTKRMMVEGPTVAACAVENRQQFVAATAAAIAANRGATPPNMEVQIIRKV